MLIRSPPPSNCAFRSTGRDQGARPGLDTFTQTVSLAGNERRMVDIPVVFLDRMPAGDVEVDVTERKAT